MRVWEAAEARGGRVYRDEGEGRGPSPGRLPSAVYIIARARWPSRSVSPQPPPPLRLCKNRPSLQPAWRAWRTLHSTTPAHRPFISLYTPGVRWRRPPRSLSCRCNSRTISLGNRVPLTSTSRRHSLNQWPITQRLSRRESSAHTRSIGEGMTRASDRRKRALHVGHPRSMTACDAVNVACIWGVSFIAL